MKNLPGFCHIWHFSQIVFFSYLRHVSWVVMLIIKANALILTCDRCLQPLTTSLLVSTLQPAGSEMCAELFWPARFPSLFLLSQTGTHCPLSLMFSHLLSNTIYWPYGHFLYEIFDFSHTVMPSCFSAFKKAISSFIHTFIFSPWMTIWKYSICHI